MLLSICFYNRGRLPIRSAAFFKGQARQDKTRQSNPGLSNPGQSRPHQTNLKLGKERENEGEDRYGSKIK
ncbi:hypothetical protein MU1_17470 [Paenibacillus glycanilyticus]|uniref:Uncharacterized protein n=1 Tax=Paenibacillus glycanilyticus TaxID=126569 RepID=A0ABQ6GEE4_9BACL|nr:hypothetical protein MU1_17470 [Paenibacillus glycanilyticus]